ncbi:MAG TPA: DUF1800 family protein [Caulobacteraceae bacterium]|jgi:uncharacterized protein (DUF1800 family)
MALPSPTNPQSGSQADLAAAIAVTRFGLGARPGEIEAASTDPKGFLKAQIRPEGADQPEGRLAPSSQNIAVFQGLRRERRELKGDADAAKQLKQVQGEIRSIAIQEMAARGRLAAATPASFRERWTLFWANHFTVSATKGQVAPICGSFEREAIRPHVFGRFEDMLVASSRHPAMLLYLDQAASAGPNSQAGERRKAGLNENLAREIMELHTVGVDGGYTQTDVTEFARAITGWSVAREQEGRQPGPRGGGGRFGRFGRLDAEPEAAPSPAGTFMFRPFTHEPGVRKVLGKSYADGGEAQGLAILHDLAVHPATARHVARKIAIHFVSDNPPPALVSRLEGDFRSTGGRLDKLAATLVDSPEAWQPQAAKLKSPYEFVVSTWRAAGTAPDLAQPQRFVGSMSALDQKPFSPPSPKGWPDSSAEWAAPDQIVKRIAWAEQAANTMAQMMDPAEVARSALGARLSPQAATAIARAETRKEAFAVLLMSPEFQRR